MLNRCFRHDGDAYFLLLFNFFQCYIIYFSSFLIEVSQDLLFYKKYLIEGTSLLEFGSNIFGQKTIGHKSDVCFLLQQNYKIMLG